MLRQFTSHTAHNRKQKHFGKRLVAGILVLLLILITMPSAFAVEDDRTLPASDIPETLTAQQLASHGAIERLRAEEDEYTFVFLNQDGTRTSYSYGVPVKFEQNGEYIDKNNTIKDFNSEYGNTASDVEIRFPKHLNKISIKYKNHNIKIKPVTSVSPGHINATVSGNAVTYYGAFGMGMDLRYASTMSGIKEDIILQSYQGANSFSFEIDTGGLEVKEQNGQYVIADGDEVIFSFGDLEVLDSFTGENEQTDNWDEHRTNAVGSIETVKANKKYIFTVTVDEDFLTSENTVYPVYIDPSFNVESTYIQDTYICEGAPNTSYTTNARMKVGYGSSSQRNRMLMQFSNYANGESRPGLDYTTVNSAVLYMNCVTTYTSQAYVDAYMIPLTASAWSVNTNATWNNQYNNTSSQAHLNGSAVVNGSGWFSFDITDAYTTWWQLFQSRGLMFRMRDEGSSPNYYREFASANHSDSTKLPHLAVNYGTETVILQVAPEECYLEVGQTQNLSVLSNLTSDEIIWYSDAPSVATVSGGVITAKAPGIAEISARSKYNYDQYDICGVTVVAQPVTGVTLNYETAYVAKGKQLTVTATVAPSNATIKDVIWSSSNSRIARVSTTGVITAVAPGTVTITAKSKQGNKTDSMTVTVPEYYIVNYYDSSLVGDTDTLSKIQIANEFATDVLYREFGITIAMDGSAVRYNNALADQCTKGINVPCDSTCGDNHHKDIQLISDQIYNDVREDNHIYVLWSNRSMNTYCLSYAGQHTYINWAALVCDHRPVIHFLSTDKYGTLSADQEEACMAINLLHEMMHVFGMGEPYLNAGHDVANDTVCAMEECDPDTAWNFYQEVKNGTSAFCSSCKSTLQNLVPNASIQGN